MSKRRHLFLIVLLLASGLVRAQYNTPQSRIWAMGNKVGLDFTNPANPQPIVTALANGNEAAAAICDTAGQLLFYTNGNTAWNRNHLQMPHGAGLTGTGGSTLSTSQGAVIVPVPGSPDKYYLFSLTAVSNCKLYCNRIDMSLNGGLGDVDTTFPLRFQSLADSFLTEKMTAVPGCNNSVWLLVHTQNSPVFRAYHITTAGINLVPVLSPVGAFAGSNYQQGVMKFSPDRTRLLSCNFKASATASAGVEVFSFDYSTGVLSNGIVLDNASHYGGTFSPDGSKVYAGTTVVMNSGSIAQWDLNAANPAASKTTLGPCGQYADLKLGPDGKIYFGGLPNSAGYSNYRFMGRINSPNLAGTACQFQDSVTALVFPHPTNINYGSLAQGLPNEVAVPMPGTTDQYIKALDTQVCALMQPFALNAPAGYDGRTWDNGDTATVRTVNARGTYWVQSSTACDLRVDTFVLGGADMPALGIAYTAPVLTATGGFASYQWYRNGVLLAGAVTNSFSAIQNGTYSVKASWSNDCSDSASYVVTDAAGIDTESLPGLSVYPNPARDMVHISYHRPLSVRICSMDGRTVLCTGPVHTIDISALPEGLYLLLLSDGERGYSIRKLHKLSK